jgi:hypothetical protein
VDEVPTQLAEAAYPLSPLVPDPTNPRHDAYGETLYFGVVPTGSSDADIRGAARYDDHSCYEIRCYARRHRAQCPRDGGHCTCEITWSEPTAAYELASHFDLEGTANRPVTVQLPDLAQLHADAIRLGPGGTGGVRFQSPVGSELAFTAENLDATARAGTNTQIQICSFAIPLLTIVALFVFRLFMPIVVFIFQLWFLLLLRFCIPPDVSIDADMAATFKSLGAGLNLDAGIATSIAGDADVNSKLDTLLRGESFKAKADPLVRTMAERLRQERAAGALDDRSFAAIARGALVQAPPEPPKRAFAPRVERAEVVRP